MEIEKYQNPGHTYRPAPLWSWNDKLTKEELCRQIDSMVKNGWGGFFMHTRVGLLTKYASQEFFDLINACADKAKEVGADAWLYDEDRWPSGFGAGEVALREENRGRALVLLKKHQITENDTVFEEYVDNDVTYYIAKRVMPLGDPWFNGTSYVDLMNPNVMKDFIKSTHEKYKEQCGERFGKEVPGIFTDEPCFLMRGHYDVPVRPWSEYLADFFEKRYGYSIMDHLPELFYEIGDYQKIRYQFYDSASALFLESYTKQYHEWCEKNNLKLVGHMMAEDSLHYQTSWAGNIMPHYEYMDYPGIDKLGRRVNQNITVKQVASVGDQLNKKRVMSEVLGCIGQQSNFVDMAWILNWEAVLGINMIVPHITEYSMRGERKRDFPEDMNYQQPWWDSQRDFMDYLARLSMAVSEGKRDAKILVIHPVGSCWAVYDSEKVPSAFDQPFEKLVDELVGHNLDFHFGDEHLMEKYARVENGKLVVGEMEYTTVVVPPVLTLRTNTYDLLDAFAKEAGEGHLIFTDRIPTRENGEKTGREIPKRAVVTTDVDKTIEYLLALLPDEIKTIDKVGRRPAKRIYCCTRVNGDTKIITMANTQNRREMETEIIITEERTPYLFDLSSGEICEIPYQREGKQVHIDATFYPSGSLAIMFTDKAVQPKAKRLYLRTGVALHQEFVCGAEAYDYQTRVLQENVLPINYATLSIGGKQFEENALIATLWKDAFHAAEDGTPFTAKYTFDVSALPQGDVFAVIECAYNLDSITINGNAVRPLGSRETNVMFDPEVNYLDVNFIRVPLIGLQLGKNELVIKGEKWNNTSGSDCHRIIDDYQNYHSTELEAIYIIGDFSVKDFNRTKFSIDGAAKAPNYKDLVQSGYPFYAGKIQISAKIDYTPNGRRPLIALNDVNCCTAKVLINGKEAAAGYMEPFIFEADGFLQEGVNIVTVELTNTLFNLFGPNWNFDILERQYVDPRSFDDPEKFTKKYAFVPFGVKGIELLYDGE